MNNLLEQIPKILQESGDLFGFVSLIVIVSTLLCYAFYLRADQADKNRVFAIILLFFLGLVIVTFPVAAFSGFQTGSETTSEQVAENPSLIDPSLVKLSPQSTQQLENYLNTQGKAIDEESKRQVLQDALDTFINPKTSSVHQTEAPLGGVLTPSQPVSQTTETISKTTEVGGFLFALDGCYRNGQTVNCDFNVTNQSRERNKISLYADFGKESAIFDGASRYVATEATLADKRGARATLEIPANVEINAQVSFSNIPTTLTKAQAVEFWISNSGYSSIMFENVPILAK